MGRSRGVLLVAAFSAVPAIVACNAILGIDDFNRVDCETFPCPVEGGPDQFVPDRDASDSGDARTDAPPGLGPVSWAAFPMPNYVPDSGLLSPDPRPIKYSEIDPEQTTDLVTTLVWRRKVVGAAPANQFGDDKNQDGARAECQKIAAGGPWRLPKRIELVTLLSYGKGAPFIDTSMFVGFPQVPAWTSSEVRPLNGRYWAVDFKTGALVQLDGKSEPAKVLCVKDKP